MAINCPSCKVEIENVIPKERFDKVNEERKIYMDKASKLEESANNMTAYEEKAKSFEKEATSAKKALERYEAAVENGIYDKSIIEVAELLHGKLGEDAPAWGDWLAGMRAKPETAPKILQPHFAPAAPQQAKAEPEVSAQAAATKEAPRASEKKTAPAVESGGKSVGASTTVYDANAIRDLDLAGYRAHRENILKST